MSLKHENRSLTLKLAVFALGSFAFGFALVPLYDVLCDITGYGNQKRLAQASVVNLKPDPNRLVTIEFLAELPTVGNWEFRPVVRSVKVHPGELTMVEYEIVNVREAPVTGQAVPSYGPQRAGEYFQKVECFCFTQQTLAAGETRRMPVTFVVDPKLPASVRTIAVSYTFFEVAGRGGKS